MNVKKQFRRISELGISNFETVEEVSQRQADMLKLLKQSSVDPDQYAGLDSCAADYCGRVNCLEACPFGALRRRLTEIPVVHNLLEGSNEPLYELRFIRGRWARPSEELGNVPITAAKKFNSRALDRLFRSTLVAVGTIKVAVEQRYERHVWVC